MNMNTKIKTKAEVTEPTTIGERIKALRKKKGISQKVLADFISIDKSVVCNWETGKRPPNRDYLDALSDYFGVTPYFLMYGRKNDAEANLLDLNGLTLYQIDIVKKLVAELRRGC